MCCVWGTAACASKKYGFGGLYMSPPPPAPQIFMYTYTQFWSLHNREVIPYGSASNKSASKILQPQNRKMKTGGNRYPIAQAISFTHSHLLTLSITSQLSPTCYIRISPYSHPKPHPFTNIYTPLTTYVATSIIYSFFILYFQGKGCNTV